MSRQPTTPPKPKPPKQIIGFIDEIRDFCGHLDRFPSLKGEPAPQTTKRKTKWKTKRCVACIQALAKKQADEAAARRAERKEALRFPIGTTITLNRGRGEAKWTATLVLPDGTSFEFQQRANPVKAVRALGDRYREHLRQKAGGSE